MAERLYNPIYNKDDKVILWEVLDIKPEQEFNIKFISTNSKYRQGIRLAIDVGEGYLEINGLKSKEMYLWEDTAPLSFHVKCKSKEGLLSIYNLFDLGPERGGVRSQTDSCGMLVDCEGDTLIYRCNDTGFKSAKDEGKTVSHSIRAGMILGAQQGLLSAVNWDKNLVGNDWIAKSAKWVTNRVADVYGISTGIVVDIACSQ